MNRLGAAVGAAMLLWHAPVAAQGPTVVSAADSALIGRLLLAEDRRAANDPALDEAARHPSPLIRGLADRARGRIADAQFPARASLPPLPVPPQYAEPAWRARYRALSSRSSCADLREAMSDASTPVRLRAMTLVSASCAADSTLAQQLAQAVDLPARIAAGRSLSMAWHDAAYALVALARVQPAAAEARLPAAVRHRTWQRRYHAVKAAAVLRDTARLRRLARDANDNVAEVAIEALSALTGHTDDALYVLGLTRGGAQVIRAAANALVGTPDATARAAASATHQRLVERANASEVDARVALLKAAGRPVTDDVAPAPVSVLPPDAVALALGAEIRLRVVRSAATGGGTFVVRLRGDNAPMMAARVLERVRAGGYDGTTWHRVEHDFVIQGGSPGANEYVGSATFLRDELGLVPHLRGTVGMSTRGHDTGDFQWFVNLRDNRRLDRDYSIFAEVIEGINVVDDILEGDVIQTIRVLPARG